ncbi:hypothetical protein ACNKHL_09885 [Shigella flexneri]
MLEPLSSFFASKTRLNPLLHQQLRMTSVISSLRRMLLIGPHRQVQRREFLEQLLTALASSKQMLTPSHVLSPRWADNIADYRHITFWQRLGSAAFICKVVGIYIVCKAV